MEKRGTELFLDRKAQITIFIILGLVILLAAATVIYIRSTAVEKRLPPIPILEEIPQQLAPIRTYTEDCVSSLAEEALIKIGQQAGYIDVQDFNIRTSSLTPTEADGIQFSPGSELKIPYWWYLKAPNGCARNCLFSSQKPDLKRTTGLKTDSSIESQIDRYIDKNLRSCLNDYAPFKEIGYTISETDDPSTTTLIGDDDIGVYLEYPLSVSIQDFRSEISQYYVSIPLDLKDMYELAKDITNAEINYTFLESQTLNLITQFAGLDAGSLPPKTESTFDYGAGAIWSVPAVKKNIEAMLMTYVPGLQVPFTLDYVRKAFPGNPLREAVYAMEIPVNLDKKYSDLSARFDYLAWWPIYFDAGQGGIIKPESLTTLFLPLGVQRYSTTYDVSYPVVVTISDPEAFDGEGYNFMFARSEEHTSELQSH